MGGCCDNNNRKVSIIGKNPYGKGSLPEEVSNARVNDDWT